ncbi:hypothetical protein NPIL_369541 [Nephila pilipes]|uniref:Uncharacterized protein n=1 Tax=Nephila pilipes TaxID=299642 RepID=A0A8X6R3J6_NEPPI|nr:hypothetical protein NPIL_369541 [Nephila pilipes]
MGIRPRSSPSVVYLPSHDEQQEGAGLVGVRSRGPFRVRLLPQLLTRGVRARRPRGRRGQPGRRGTQSRGRPSRQRLLGSSHGPSGESQVLPPAHCAHIQVSSHVSARDP